MDLADLDDDDDSLASFESNDGEDPDYAANDPIEAERARRIKQADREKLRRRAGEPEKPPVVELAKLHPDFVLMLRKVLGAG
jgi:hypothetical protein